MASTIKVDNVQNQPGTNIVNKCGTDVTLGASGDTIALASGASQTGFGRTGTVDWVTTPKVTGDSPVTAATGSGYFLNTTAGEITINLPAGAAGSIVSMADYAATWQTNKVTVAANGSEKIGGITDDAFLETEGQSVTFVYVDSTQGWINTMDSTSNVRGQPPYIVATVSGACNAITTSGDYKIATFKGPGTFTVCTAAICAADNIVDYVVVAGGGGAGGTNCTGGGGAGAGGFRYFTNTTNNPQPGAPGLPLNNFPSGVTITATATGYPITVGGGGAGGSGSPHPGGLACNGNPSTFSTVTSAGGGASAGYFGPSPCNGYAGGSGGGGSYNGDGAIGNDPATPIAQGTAGGDGTTCPQSGGGGGGALVAGLPGTPTGTGGAGAGVRGFGTTGESSGSDYYFSGGGGGATDGPGTLGVGGLGGGADGSKSGSPNPAAAGTINTGGGGGGAGGGSPTTYVGGAGGSGIVIIRYKYQ